MSDVLIVSESAASLAALVGEDAWEDPAAVPDEMFLAPVLLADPHLAVDVMGRMPNLRWIQSTWAGVDRLLSAGVAAGVAVTAMKDVFGSQMREFVVGHLLAHTQNVVKRFADRSWDVGLPPTLAGKRMGVLGTGSIGKAIAATGNHFGMEVLGCSRSGSPVAGFIEVFGVEKIHEFANGLDHLVAVLPSTQATRALVGDAVVARLAEGATLINVGRGDTVVVEAVVAGLRRGHLSLAVLDVLPVEPLADGDPLWDEPNLVITSHSAAWTRPEDVARVFVENLGRYNRGETLVGLVDPGRGY